MVNIFCAFVALCFLLTCAYDLIACWPELTRARTWCDLALVLCALLYLTGEWLDWRRRRAKAASDQARLANFNLGNYRQQPPATRDERTSAGPHVAPARTDSPSSSDTAYMAYDSFPSTGFDFGGGSSHDSNSSDSGGCDSSSDSSGCDSSDSSGGFD